MIHLDRKVIVVTGGCGLLGSSFCEAISESGGISIVADLDYKKAEKISNHILKKGLFSEPRKVDISDKESIQSLIDYLHQKYTRIDGLVNNAYPRNKNWGKKLEDVEYLDFCYHLNVHLGGYFLCSQLFSKFFKSQRFGSIINMGSIYGVISPRFEIYEETNMTSPIEYAAIKSGIIHLTKYFAQYYKKEGIRVNSISPGGIRDNQDIRFIERYNAKSGKKGMLEPKDIIGTLIFLLSDASSFINGQNLIVDDGFSL